MRSRPRKNKAGRMSCRKNSKSCLTAKTRIRTPRQFLRPSCASRSPFEAQGSHFLVRAKILPFLLFTSSFLLATRVSLAFSCLAAVPWAEGDFRRRLPFADACRPFERYALPFVDCAPFVSSCAVGQHDLRFLP